MPFTFHVSCLTHKKFWNNCQIFPIWSKNIVDCPAWRPHCLYPKDGMGGGSGGGQSREGRSKKRRESRKFKARQGSSRRSGSESWVGWTVEEMFGIGGVRGCPAGGTEVIWSPTHPHQSPGNCWVKSRSPSAPGRVHSSKGRGGRFPLLSLTGPCPSGLHYSGGGAPPGWLSWCGGSGWMVGCSQWQCGGWCSGECSFLMLVCVMLGNQIWAAAQQRRWVQIF